MKRNEISGLFTSHVIDAINEGFDPCMTELTGSYSNVMGSHMVFAKGSERIVMWIEEEERRVRNVVPHATLYVARIELGNDKSLERSYYWPHEWKENVVYTKKVYLMSHGVWSDAWYTTDEEEAIAARNKHRERYANSDRPYVCKEFEMTDRLFAIVRKLKGFKTVKRENVRVWKCNGVWHIENTKSKNVSTLSA